MFFQKNSKDRTTHFNISIAIERGRNNNKLRKWNSV